MKPQATESQRSISGGTPSSLPESQLRKLLEILPVGEAQEITIEVNPEDVSERLAAFIAESPINRVSMGIQTLDDNQLRFIGRRHSASDAIAAYERLRAAGIGNISLDLIFGLPGQTSNRGNGLFLKHSPSLRTIFRPTPSCLRRALV